MIQTTLYAGPYALVTCDFAELPEQVRRCPQDSCMVIGSDAKGDYCHKCGKSIVTVEGKKEVAKVNQAAVMAAVNNALYHRYVVRNGNQLLVSWTPADQKRKAPRNPTWSDNSPAFCEAITPTVIEEEVAWFREAYVAEIRTLAEKYGEVEVHWGMIAEVA